MNVNLVVPLEGLKKAMLVKEAAASTRLDGETQSLECEHELVEGRCFVCGARGDNLGYRRIHEEGYNTALSGAARILVKHQHCKAKHKVVSKGESFEVSCIDMAIREMQELRKE